MKQTKLRILRYSIAAIPGACLLTVAIAFAAGCASKQKPATADRPGGGIAEYRQLASYSAKAIQVALASLDAVAEQTNQCTAESLAAFSAEVQQIQVDSVQVRAHSQAMQARGDAYFERWHENMARVKDSQVRALAEARRPLLLESFHKIKSLSEQAHEAFTPFLSGMRKVRNALEKDPASVGAEATQNWIGGAKANGEQVLRSLAGIQRELDSMTMMITPPRPAAKN